ncbi:methionine ABC transporter ATP-binding protein [Fodinicurvata sp. EGI_FJ10296]|uniref:methionine ABC transporter ATP-binding protein n=1 Tax=Fodinicurvata sp. EGI_FJ10296 TaxID=3231908 RepID=UPI003455139B
MITLNNVSKRYPERGKSAEVSALEAIDLEIGRGEIFGVIGRSGAGKSTLVRLINLLEKPTEGTVTVDGMDMTALSPAALRAARRQIGMIFQHFNLLSSRTVFDNVALPLELAGMNRREIAARVAPLLDRVGLTDKANRYPAELSGGQKQRVGIARALATEPKVLLCDEATSALDPETTRAILDLLADINAELGITIVLITHEMHVIRQICQQVAVLDGGRLAELASVEQILSRPEAEITERLLAATGRDALPPAIGRRLSPEPVGSGSRAVLRLRLAGAGADGNAALSLLSRSHGLDVSILQAQVDVVRETAIGTLLVGVPATGERLASAITLLETNNVTVEPLGYIAADLRAAG